MHPTASLSHWVFRSCCCRRRRRLLQLNARGKRGSSMHPRKWDPKARRGKEQEAQLEGEAAAEGQARRGMPVVVIMPITPLMCVAQ